MQKRSLSVLEVSILLLVAVMLAIGFFLFYTNLDAFLIYTVEDGIVEWLTVLGLLLGAAVCIARFIRLQRKRSWIFLLLTLLLGILLIGVAGEEVSWGQRIFHIRSSEFFRTHNTQSETNFHNMVLDGVRINKIIFTFGLIAALGFFLVIVPLLYHRNRWVKTHADRYGILIPRLYQIVAFIALFAITALLHHEKNSELLEGGAAFLFFLIVRNPVNRAIFNKRQFRR